MEEEHNKIEIPEISINLPLIEGEDKEKEKTEEKITEEEIIENNKTKKLDNVRQNQDNQKEPKKKENNIIKPTDEFSKYKTELNKLKISNTEEIKNLDTTVIFNSFLKKVNNISNLKNKYEKNKEGYYESCCCFCFLDCFCCKCCNYEFCCCCKKCSLSVIKGNENQTEEERKMEMNKLRDEEDNLIDSLEALKQNVSHKESEISKDLNFWRFYAIFIFVSLVHFFLMAIIEAILFSYMRETFRTIYFYFHHEYEEDNQKDFEYYLIKSSKNDSSQINFNYLSSIITDLLVSRTNFYIPYLISNIIIIAVTSLMLLFRFLEDNEIKEGKNYSPGDFATLCIALGLTYICSGIISLYPIYILKLTDYYQKWSILLICFLLTISIIIKNIIQGYFELNYIKHLFCLYIFSATMCITLILYYCLSFKKKEERNNKNEEQKDHNTNNSDLLDENQDITSIKYVLGYLLISNNSMKIMIKLKGFKGYLKSFFKNPKIILLLFINFLGRTQKLKSKIDYKLDFDQKFWWTILNFFISFILYGILYVCIHLCTKKFENYNQIKEKNYIIELIIVLGLIVENITIIILSIMKFFFDNSAISFIAITVSGCFNFILYEYYSTVEIEYITASGLISIPQIIFRFIEQSIKFLENYYLWIQIGCGVVGIILNIVYIIYLSFLNKEKSSKLIEEIDKIDKVDDKIID